MPQCARCALEFKTVVELTRHVKSVHSAPSSVATAASTAAAAASADADALEEIQGLTFAEVYNGILQHVPESTRDRKAKMLQALGGQYTAFDPQLARRVTASHARLLYKCLDAVLDAYGVPVTIDARCDLSLPAEQLLVALRSARETFVAVLADRLRRPASDFEAIDVSLPRLGGVSKCCCAATCCGFPTSDGAAVLDKPRRWYSWYCFATALENMTPSEVADKPWMNVAVRMDAFAEVAEAQKLVPQRQAALMAVFERHEQSAFRCPFNHQHSRPFEMVVFDPTAPDAERCERRPVHCPECNVSYCSHCSELYHPFVDDGGDRKTSCDAARSARAWSTEAAFAALATRCAVEDEQEVNARESRALLKQASSAAAAAQLADLDVHIARVEADIAGLRSAAGAPTRVAADERKCYHCGYGPIRRISGCDNMTCGLDAYGSGADRGGCKRRVQWDSMPRYVPPPSAAAAGLLHERQVELERVRRERAVRAKIVSGQQASFDDAEPAVVDHFPAVTCANCRQPMLRTFYLQCVNCANTCCAACVVKGAAAAHCHGARHAWRQVNATVW